MKLVILFFAFVSASFASTGRHQQDVINILDKSVYYGDIAAYHELEFIGVNVSRQETYKLTYTYDVYGDGSYNHDGQDINEIIGSHKDCEYIVYDTSESDFLFTGLKCSEPTSKALGRESEFENSEAEISEVLQTDQSFDFILDYEVPLFVTKVRDDIEGDIEIYKLGYVNTDNEFICEYITFDPERNHLELTGVTCDKPVDDVIDEDLIEID